MDFYATLCTDSPQLQGAAGASKSSISGDALASACCRRLSFDSVADCPLTPPLQPLRLAAPDARVSAPLLRLKYNTTMDADLGVASRADITAFLGAQQQQVRGMPAADRCAVTHDILITHMDGHSMRWRAARSGTPAACPTCVPCHDSLWAAFAPIAILKRKIYWTCRY